MVWRGVQSVPLARPVLISPAKTERKVGLSAFPDLVYRTLENLPPIEPIVIEAKPVDSVARGQLGLSCPRLWQSQIIKPQISRQVWLVMPWKSRPSSYDACPFREPLPPPFIILRDWMELGKVEGNGANGRLLYCVLFGTHVRHKLAADTQG